eukprot:353380-Chlamydomonas_euryale.AAC.1
MRADPVDAARLRLTPRPAVHTAGHRSAAARVSAAGRRATAAAAGPLAAQHAHLAAEAGQKGADA